MEVLDQRKKGIAEKIKDSDFARRIKGMKNAKIIACIFIIAIGLVIYSTVAPSRASKKRRIDHDGRREAALGNSFERGRRGRGGNDDNLVGRQNRGSADYSRRREKSDCAFKAVASGIERAGSR